MTANLQTFTVRQAARLMNVSERTVYMARELVASGNTDIIRAAEEGRISLLAALKIAKPERYNKKPDGCGALLMAWNKADSDERTAFLATIGQGAQ